MRVGNREILVVGDRVLVRLEKPEERTNVGLYLPQTVVEKEKVAAGRIVSTGPGTPLPSLEDDSDEPWKESVGGGRYVPMQAQVGDQALFLKKAAVEIKLEDETYYVVPQAAILVLVREDAVPPGEW